MVAKLALRAKTAAKSATNLTCILIDVGVVVGVGIVGIDAVERWIALEETNPTRILNDGGPFI